MKKYIPAVVAFLVIILAFFAFTQVGKAPETPSLAEGNMGTTTEEETPSAPWHDPSVGLNPSATGVLTSSDWKIAMTIGLSWVTSRAGETLFVHAENASFTINEDKPIAKPQLIPFRTETRTIAGQSVVVTIYDNPDEEYANFEFFELPLGNDTYYFKAKSTVANDPDYARFYSGIKIK